ncbi:hypothetical protein D8M04_02925 [Oceanobacillus piezotolerans]|uniref:Isoprenylcysteine carboxyl methyltransferase n=1 Tax=Oceanobacillus piezotolerans TaxID=2448030 RepID=A0A498DA85_9BACI|nr:isoprenylcysteine carboxylmethyltransferase family protein [Oceanobacillus piezotolerans]RLL48243.1 hypothetical protein D8M04_02925 [Oceanobacillus piezotolerans]
MAIYMSLLFLFILAQRLIELVIAKRNEQWMKERGGIELGSEHYKWFIVLHTLFFISILFEVLLRSNAIEFHNVLFAIFILLQLARVWCIQTLGRFWNTKIIVLPNVSLIKKGPYKYMKHPNYVIVGLELMTIPLLFNAYWTAVIFPVLHLILLKIRIPAEDTALKKVSKT